MSRFSDSPFTRRDRHSAGDGREDSRTVDLFLQFRQFRPYLKCRLRRIHADNRQREFREEVDDIKYLLSVMSDMLADENHGAAALQGFIDRIHEMVRKNPLADIQTLQVDSDPEVEEVAAPRSPSPTDVPYDTFTSPAETARTIPLERDTPEFSYFDSIEASIERSAQNRRRQTPSSRSDWDLENDPYNTRGPSQDIDMRNSPAFNAGHGPPRQSQWQANSENYRSTSFGRGISRESPRDENYKNNSSFNWEDDDENNSSQNQGFRRKESFSDKSNNESWRGDSFASFNRGGRGGSTSNDYNRASNREYSSHNDYSREFNREQERPYERTSFPRESTYERNPPQSQTQADSMFERRSQLEGRRRQSNASYAPDGSLHIDYNHGAGGAEIDPWTTPSDPPEIRYKPTSASTSAGIFPQQNHQQQMYLNQPNINFGVNPYLQTIQNQNLIQGLAAAASAMTANLQGISTSNLNMTVPSVPSNLHFQPQQPPNHHTPPVVQPPVQPRPSFVRQPAPTSVPFNYPEVPGPPNYNKPVPAPSNSDMPTTEKLKEMFKKKAQENFGIPSRPSIPPPKVPPPHKSPQGGLLASNQMLSDRDPRAYRSNKRPSQGSSPSHSESPSAQNNSKEVPKGAPLDPRLMRRERDSDSREKSTHHDNRSDNEKRKHSDHHRYHHDKSKSRDDSRDRNSSHSSSSDRNNRDRGDVRDRVARVNLDPPDLNSRRLDEARNRVKEKLPTVTGNKSSSKLQEIRKQVEKERFHVLGRPTSKKPSSFDEAIIVPVETAVRPPHKEASSKPTQKNKDIPSKETENYGSQKDVSKDKDKQKEKMGQKDLQKEKTGKQKKLRKISEDSSSGSSKAGQNKKDKRNLKSQRASTSLKTKASKSQQSNSEPEPPKKAVFRIPKIKKPDPPPPPPKSPSPEPEPEPVSLPVQESQLSEPDISSPPSATPNSAAIEEFASEKFKLLTDDFIRQFVMSEMKPPEASAILDNPDVLAIVKERLKNQIVQLFKNTSSVTDTGPQQQQEPDNVPVEPETGASEIEPGGHQSRSPTKKRNSKRRSSLEKLHDALQEWGFDHILPLGPRKCTLAPIDDESSSTGTPENKDSAKTKESKKNSPISKTNELAKSTIEVPSTSSDNNEKQTPVSKKGTKRKRKASKVKPNKKKKKGPATRAQAAVKSAIKIQHKDKPGVPSQKKKKADKNLSEGARVTRSMRGSAINRIKIKVEPFSVKEEPDDQSYDDCATSETEVEHVEENSQTELDSMSKNDIPASSTINLRLPSFDNDDADDADVDMAIDIDIKDEPRDFEQIHDVSQMQEEVSAEAPVEMEVADTNYDEDLTDFLPDIPTIQGECSLPESEDSDSTSAMDLIFNQIDSYGSRVDTSEPRPDSADFRRECFTVVDSMLNQLEEQEMEEQDYSAPGLDNHMDTVPCGWENSKPADDMSDSDFDDGASEEPNDFFQTDTPSDEESSKLEDVKPITVSVKLEPTSDQENVDEDHDVKDVKPFFAINKIKLERTADPSDAPGVDGDFRKCKGNLAFPDLSTREGGKEVVDGTDTDMITTEMEQTSAEQTVDTDMTDLDQPPASATNGDPSLSDSEPGRVTNLRGRDLYKCPNAPCDFSAPNGALLKDHLPTCPCTTDIKSVGCRHCDKRVKAVVNLLEHLKVHGQQKQICSLCKFRTWATSELSRHMKTVHKVYNHKVEKVEASDPDDDPEIVIYPKDVAARISTPQQLKDSYACYADRLIFTPNDVDKIPNRQIFQSSIYCATCPYSTKIRINLIRHLQAHTKMDAESDHQGIPTSDPVNPVPCLERKELMFDKMTNWAGSSHENKTGNVNSDSSTVPQFVSEQFRYVCNVKGCEQITVDEYMLRTHIRTLHSTVEYYECPHCAKHEVTRNDKRNTVPVDKLGVHLKLHGPKLYRCAYCDVIHTQLPLMEKHIPEKHPERKPIHYLVRNLDNDGNPANRRNSNDEQICMDKWRCTLCASKQLFSSCADVKNHCKLTHKICSQFLCYECKFEADDDESISRHVLECTPDNKDGKILIMWYRSEFASKPEDIIHGPLWKRSASIKHIRGIFLEVSEKCPKYESSKPIQPSREKIAAPCVGKTNRRPYKPKSAEKASPDQPAVSLPPKIYTCPKCNIFKTRSGANMRVHLYNEMGYQRYRCTKCNVKFVTESSLKGHLVGDHGVVTGESFLELLPVDTEIETFVNAFFAAEAEKDLHSNTLSEVAGTDAVTTSTDPKQPVFLCKHCSQECQNAHNLKTHILAKHIASDRYACEYCKATFWNKSLARNHILKTHKDLPQNVEENFYLNLTPEFWSTEYGIPPIPSKRALKRSMDEDGNFAEPLPTTSESSNLASRTTDDYELTRDDNIFFNFSDCDIDSAMIDGLAASVNEDGVTEDAFLQQLMEESNNEIGPNRAPTYNPNAYAYKCYHCGENTLSVRGARGHWEKIHSHRPEDRCNYYEYKSFNELNQLPPCVQLSCSLCDYVVSSLSLMQDHHELAHPANAYRMKRKLRIGFMVFECGICFHECSSKVQVLEHIHTAHPTIREPLYVITDLRDKMESNPDKFVGKLVEDKVRYACLDPLCGFDFETRLESQNHMVSVHAITPRKANIKYIRYILTPTVQVPIKNGSIEPTKIYFQCPRCPYKSDQRQKLVTEHLGEHVHTYICPNTACNKSFVSYIDTKFHIRLQHADPEGTPLINRSMVKAREELENTITKVDIHGKRLPD